MQEQSNSFKPVPILLIGFNRIEKLLDRVLEIREFSDVDLYISIDWKSNAQQDAIRKILEKLIQEWPTERNVEVYYQNVNLGLARHITSAISRVLELHDAVIILEDDIKVSKDFIKFATYALNQEDFCEKYSAVCGFSVLRTVPRLKFPNFYRNSIYFFCWGWGTKKSVWEKYKLQLDLATLEAELNNSNIWKSLRKKQQATWLGRFYKVANDPMRTWDIQFQYMTFKENLLCLAPIFRVTENCGFSDDRSSNTKEKRPWWLGSDKLVTTKISHQSPILLSKLIRFVDSNTLIGDSDSIRNKFNSIKLLRIRRFGRNQ